jgi:hypothetical protein
LGLSTGGHSYGFDPYSPLVSRKLHPADSGNYVFDIGNAMCCTLDASADSVVEAGAPVDIVEIRLALEDEFNDWRAENDYLLSVGLSGDVSDLRLRLNAAFAKASIFSLDASRAA